MSLKACGATWENLPFFSPLMPVATPPNAVVFGSKRIRIIEMARTGLVLDFVAMAFALLAVYFLFPFLTGSSIHDFPAWAK